MINLIPPDARKMVQIEYWVRVVSVWLILMSIASVTLVALLLPSLVLVRSQLDAYENQYQHASEQNDSYAQLEEEVALANAMAAHLIDNEYGNLFSLLLTELNTISGEKIDLDYIGMSRADDAKVNSISINGSAHSRAELVAFRDRIEEHTSFETAELPLSNLAKDVDVPFNITIITSKDIYN